MPPISVALQVTPCNPWTWPIEVCHEPHEHSANELASQMLLAGSAVRRCGFESCSQRLGLHPISDLESMR